MLKVVVDGDDDRTSSGADSGEQRVVLTEVTAEGQPANVVVLRSERLNDFPGTVAAGIVDEDELRRQTASFEYRPAQPYDLGDRVFAVVSGNDDRDIGNRHGRPPH